MKYISYLLFFCLSFSCSTNKNSHTSPTAYLELNKAHAAKHKACIQHRTQILEKPIRISEDAELDDELYFFTRDEKQALHYIENFDLRSFTLKENQLELEAIINACVMETDPKHVICETHFSAYKFFRGLIYGMNQYSWSASTKEKAKNLSLKYMLFVAQSESSLMDILYANDLLMRLTDQGYVDRSLNKETFVFRKKGEKVYKDLQKQIKKLGKKKLTCEAATSFYKNERSKVKELAQAFLELLAKIK